MKRLIFFTAIFVAFVWFVQMRYVLSTGKLETAINRELPVGSTKADVLKFLEARQPLFYDDRGMVIKARLSGLAENMLYKKDLVVTFSLDTNGKLISHSMKAFFTFL